MVKLAGTAVGFWGALALLPGSVFAAGALATIGGHDGRYGYSYNYESMAQAERRALKECGDGCTIATTFEDACIAYATDQANGSSAMGWGKAPTDNEAAATALRYCSKYGGHGSDCVVRVQACDAN